MKSSGVLPHKYAMFEDLSSTCMPTWGAPSEAWAGARSEALAGARSEASAIYCTQLSFFVFSERYAARWMSIPESCVNNSMSGTSLVLSTETDEQWLLNPSLIPCNPGGFIGIPLLDVYNPQYMKYMKASINSIIPEQSSSANRGVFSATTQINGNGDHWIILRRVFTGNHRFSHETYSHSWRFRWFLRWTTLPSENLDPLTKLPEQDSVAQCKATAALKSPMVYPVLPSGKRSHITIGKPIGRKMEVYTLVI